MPEIVNRKVLDASRFHRRQQRKPVLPIGDPLPFPSEYQVRRVWQLLEFGVKFGEQFL